MPPTLKPADGVPDFPYTVSHVDAELFVFKATARTSGDFTWWIGVHWLCGERSGVLEARENGQPFRTVTDGRSQEWS